MTYNIGCYVNFFNLFFINCYMGFFMQFRRMKYSLDENKQLDQSLVFLIEPHACLTRIRGLPGNGESGNTEEICGNPWEWWKREYCGYLW